MDFDIKVSATRKTGDTLSTHSTTEQFEEAMVTIREAMSQWNNFLSNEPLHITIKKVPNQTETLGIQTGESIALKDRMA